MLDPFRYLQKNPTEYSRGVDLDKGKKKGSETEQIEKKQVKTIASKKGSENNKLSCSVLFIFCCLISPDPAFLVPFRHYCLVLLINCCSIHPVPA